MSTVFLERREYREGLTDDEHAEQIDWEHFKTVKYNRKNINSLKRQAKKMLATGKYFEVHICGWEDENDDPAIQEFHKKDGSKFKMF